MKSRFALGLLVASTMLGVAFEEVSAAPLALCQHNKTGALRVAATCKKKETAVTINTEGPQGAQGIQGPQGNQGPPGYISVTDADNEPLGYLLDGYQVEAISGADPTFKSLHLPAVWIPNVGGKTGVIAQLAATAQTNLADVVEYVPYYKQPDCLGLPYFPELVAHTLLAREGSSYFIYEAATPSVEDMASYKPQGPTGACQNLNQKIFGAPYSNSLNVTNDLPFLGKKKIKLPLKLQ
jgi:hypothetical protein